MARFDVVVSLSSLVPSSCRRIAFWTLKCLPAAFFARSAQSGFPCFLPASLALTLAAFAFFLPSPAQAQLGPVNGATSTPIPGAGHDYIGDLVDTVNPADGTVSIRIKTPTPSGRGINIPFSFNYDSAGTIQPNFNGTSVVPSANPVYLSSGGWTYGVPRLDASEITVPNPLGYHGYCDYITSYVFTDAAGTRHATSSDYAYTGCQGNPFVTHPGAGDWQFQAYLSASSNTFAASDPSGTTYTFTDQPNCSPPNNGVPEAALPSAIEDRNGNLVTFSVPDCNGDFSVQDTLSRTAIHSSGFGVSGNTVAISGLQQPYTLTWESTPNANASVGVKNIAGANCKGFLGWTGSMNVVSAIQLPNGQTFSFGYDPTYGLLNKVVYPSGAYVSYAWENNPLSASYQYGPGGLGQGFYCQLEYDTFAIAHRYVYNPSNTLILQQDFSGYGTTWNSDGLTWQTKTTTVTTTDKITGLVAITSYTYSPITLANPPYVYNVLAPQTPVEQTIVYKDSGQNTLRTVAKTWFNQFDLATEQMTQNGLTSETDYNYTRPGDLPPAFVHVRIRQLSSAPSPV